MTGRSGVVLLLLWGLSWSGATSAAGEAPIPSARGSAEADPGPLPARSASEYHEEGVLLLRQGKPERALAGFEQALSLDPSSALFATDYGFALLVLHKLPEAEAAFRKAIELDPKRYHGYVHLVECVVAQPQRWEKRAELMLVLERGLAANRTGEAQARLAVARILAELSFGLVERAREHLTPMLARRDLSRGVAKQVLELQRRIEHDDAAQALRDWPEPPVSDAARAQLASCETRARSGSKQAALSCLGELLRQRPGWRLPRRLRAEIAAEQGYVDQAVLDYSVLVRIQPTEATFQRRLGLLLAEHGGLLELERANQALHVAQQLEPEWTELQEIRNRLVARRMDAPQPRGDRSSTPSPPTEEAQRLYDEAERRLDEEGADRAAAQLLLEEALKQSPAFVEAAALWSAIAQRLPESTVRALWDDGGQLLSLHREVRRLFVGAPRESTDRWLLRAVELESVDARLDWVLALKERGQLVAAEQELSNYLAELTNPEEMAVVQRLRVEVAAASGAEERPDPLTTAKQRLLGDDPEGALAALEVPCRKQLGPARLLWAGIAYERGGKEAEALGCYDLAAPGLGPAEEERMLLRRLARLLARGDSSLLELPAARRLPQLVAYEPAALWALARRSLLSGDRSLARVQTERYLQTAAQDDRFVTEAKALVATLEQSERTLSAQQSEGQRRRRLVWLLSGTGFSAVLVAAYLLWWRGTTVARALLRRPGLYGIVVRIVGELRHDVLKHRTSSLELLVNDPTCREAVRMSLLEPTPTSSLVAAAYGRLVVAARAEGITLRRLAREPVFGGLVRDLRRAERVVSTGVGLERIAAIDKRLRSCHVERLERLLQLGPRFRLDAAQLQRWLETVQAELAAKREPWVAPALQMSEPSFLFPVEERALFQIFSNLVRNAQAAVRDEPEPRLVVAVSRSSDFSGRSRVALAVGDNARALTQEEVEGQVAGRGLAIIRETAAAWHGQVVVQVEPSPYSKSVGVRFAP